MTGRHARKPTPTAARRRRWRIIAACAAAGGLLLALGGYYVLTRPLTGNQPKGIPGVRVTPNQPEAERTTILLIGSDTRPGETGGNTDVLILCSIDRKNKRIELLSIPRDTKVMYPDGSYGKINQGLALGGPPLTESLVQSLVDQPIDYYALTHFGGLVDIINTLGGIRVYVPERMYYNTGDAQYNIINLQKGWQTLNGVQALGFVRYRHDALGDIGRTERQQEFLTALAHKLLQPDNIPRLPTLIREFWGTIDTDMNLLDVLGLASKAQEYQNYNIISETLPGSFHNPDPHIPGDQSYWIVNPLEAKYVAQQFFTDGVVIHNPIQDPNVTENWSPSAPSSSPSGPSNSATEPANSTTSPANGAGAPPAPATNSVMVTTNTEMVTTAAAYIRSGPGKQYAIVGSTGQGQTVWVIGKSGDWSEVSLGGGQTGYIASWLLTPATP